MKKTKIFLTLVLSMFILMFGKTDIQAETILENHYTNPYYEDVEISSSSDNDADTYSLEQKMQNIRVIWTKLHRILGSN